MLAVSDDLNCHLRDGIDALHCTLMLVLPDVVHTCHGVVEMSGVRESCVERFPHIRKLSHCVGDRGKHSMIHQGASELLHPREFRGGVPTADNLGAVKY